MIMMTDISDCTCKYPWPLKVYKKKDDKQSSPADPEQYRVHEPSCPQWIPGPRNMNKPKITITPSIAEADRPCTGEENPDAAPGEDTP